jgi:hypothetical protein
MASDTEPFQAGLSPDIARLLRPLLPRLALRIIRAVSEEVPQYARPLEGEFGRAVRNGTESALARFVEVLEDRALTDDPGWRRVYVELGRGEFREGRSLDALLGAYRVGARHAWRGIVEAARPAGVAPDDLYRLGEALFEYIDQLSGLSVEGYAAEQSSQAGERQRHRRALAALLLRDPPADAATLQRASRAAGWPVPPTVAVLVAATDDAAQLAGRLGVDALALAADGIASVVIPDPDAPGRRSLLARGLEEPAALGPTVPTADAPRSAQRARQALALAREGLLPADGLVICDDHLLDLLVHRDEALLEDVRRRALAPLEELRGTTRGRLEDTLRAYLDHAGRMEPTAHALGVHPQTVRYRVSQLRDLLGAALDTADGRLMLAVALRARDRRSRDRVR